MRENKTGTAKTVEINYLTSIKSCWCTKRTIIKLVQNVYTVGNTYQFLQVFDHLAFFCRHCLPEYKQLPKLYYILYSLGVVFYPDLEILTCYN